MTDEEVSDLESLIARARVCALDSEKYARFSHEADQKLANWLMNHTDKYMKKNGTT